MGGGEERVGALWLFGRGWVEGGVHSRRMIMNSHTVHGRGEVGQGGLGVGFLLELQ